jgi:DNA-binding transcriptional regulator YhcF (GntR family)
MIENPLEFDGGLGGLMRRKVGEAANVDGVEAAKPSGEADASKGEIVTHSGLQRVNRGGRIVRVQFRTLAPQLKVTPNTIVKAYDELESSGVAHMRRRSGTFVSEGRPQLARRERLRIIEQRIDALLAEAHQLSFTADDILRMVRERKAAMDPGTPPNRRTWRNSR